MGLFSLYKPKEYKYRYIYYDPKKEAQKEREKQREAVEKMAESGEYKPTITPRNVSRNGSTKQQSPLRDVPSVKYQTDHYHGVVVCHCLFSVEINLGNNFGSRVIFIEHYYKFRRIKPLKAIPCGIFVF
jgi:hypothetical protein